MSALDDVQAGDPASCSRLGGALRSHAGTLLRARDDLLEEMAAARPGRRAASPPGLGRALDHDLALLDTAIDELDRSGSALQTAAQELAALGEDLRQLRDSVAGHGLALDGLVVVEPWGLLPADTATQRRQTIPMLQQRADRIASRLGRARAAVQRAAVDATTRLRRAAAANRDTLGG